MSGRNYTAVLDTDESSELAQPLGRVSDVSPRPSEDQTSSWNETSRSPHTPEREAASSPNRPSAPRTNSGIVFGSPRRSPKLSNPFSDLKSGQYSSVSSVEDVPKAPTVPATTLAYHRRVPDETANQALYNVHATPVNDDEHYDEKAIALVEDDREADEEEAAMLLAKAKREEDAARKPWAQKSRWSKLNPFARRSSPTRSMRGMSWAKWIISAFVAVFVLLLAAVLLFTVNLRKPHVYWKGTLADSFGSVDPTGFNFTRHVSLGFTSPNIFRTTILSLETVAGYDNTHYFGYGSNDHVNMDIAILNRRNATLPLEINFGYIAVQDPDQAMLKSLYDTCNSAGTVPFTLMVRAKVMFMGVVGYTTELARLPASMSCDNNMAILVQSLYIQDQL
ncbi:protein of unknown function [Taphrina deformans PYCC 5710]|uniref:Late embryogenesis abundant protein LEA-2 subgroup domain-containing protein n=1 Tax=Taphrina deformans (strain PYCC 5710 / ATCC 11124 / CBS 356.35 / IMI 108563 / JCM 9778 / NBRC 8474) TaxID=1097556 RepID=R4XA80_TAPDE|nr:protein of unknown function [Taphrina deformans PYCC 5710]|eukprot:CCG81179.1 protein of unknown function [Taphrina deformans PYCC 5710]